MMSYLPLFPLQIVVFPGEQLNLHIFEERYKQLIVECFSKDIPFGIVPVIDEQVKEYGTTVKIAKIEKVYPNGNMDVRTTGIELFRLLEFMEKSEAAPYPGAVVIVSPEEMNPLVSDKADPETFKILKELLAELSGALGIHKNLIPSDERFVSFKVAHYLNMPVDQEYELLLTTDETARQQRLVHFIREILPDVVHKETVRHKISMNGHFKHLTPPEV